MITEKMLSAINDIDEEMIADAAPGKRYEKISYVQRRHRIYRIASLAACLCVVVAVMAIMGGRETRQNNTAGDGEVSWSANSNEADMTNKNVMQENASQTNHSNAGPERVPENQEDVQLAKLDIPVISQGAADRVSIYPKGELPYSGTVYSSDVPETFTVYEDLAYHPSGVPHGLDRDAMMGLLSDYSVRLGMDEYDVEDVIEKDVGQTGEDWLTALEAESDGIRLTVEADSDVEVVFTSMALEDVNLILDYDDPIISQNGLYSREGEYTQVQWIYTENGNIFKYAAVTDADPSDPDDQGVILHIADYEPVSRKIGDYPSISPDQAKELLLKGGFVRGVGPEDIPDESSIVSCYLSYEFSSLNEIFMPFYHFWVKLPDEKAAEYCGEDMDAYALYYVPAIDGKYINGAPGQ